MILILLISFILSHSANSSAERLHHEPDCVVCMERESTHFFHPCGHFCVCQKCAKRKFQTCPMCRAAVESKEKYEIPPSVELKTSIGEIKRQLVRKAKEKLDSMLQTDFYGKEFWEKKKP